ncbi:MAG: hypothetical protein ACXVAE_02160 [Candidatus Limnocylindrales bacterium]|jgi:hypothetical protein
MSSTAEMLGELASEAALERTSFLVDATRQLERFLKNNADRVRELGGLVLIDDDPDYLSIAPDSSFRSRTRYQDSATGQWVSETEVIESAAELIELYNPAEVYAAFAEAARGAAGLPEEPTGAEELAEAAGLAPDERVVAGGGPYAEAADMWAATRDEPQEPGDATSAARLVYDLALTFQERSQQTEASLLEQFQDAVGSYTHWLGDTLIVDDDDERLSLQSNGTFRGEVIPEEEDAGGRWKTLTSPDELVQFYDPTDVFGDLADSLAELHPDIAPEDEAEA